MKKFLPVILLHTFLFAESIASPNILILYIDDLGWRDTGFMGSDFYETPHLDMLAGEGMVFTNAYSASANCAPARASLLSGQYTPRHKVYNVGTNPRGKAEFRRLEHIPGTDVLDPDIITWAECFQRAGYATAHVGKWHLSEDSRPYGFDINVGGSHAGSPPNGYYPPHPGVSGLGEFADDEYLTDTLTDRTIAFIEAHQDEPWLIYLSHFAVHTPLHAKRELISKYEEKPKGSLHDHVAMATMVEALDQGVGRIRQKLEELNLLKNTIIIFFSDNGGYGPATDMSPLYGYKGNYYEGGIRVPFFVRWDGVVEGARISEEPIIGVDLYPTLCEMAGIPLPQDQPLDGVSLVPYLKGETPELENRSLFWHFPAYLQAYSVFDEQPDPLFRSRPCSVVRRGKWKLHYFFEDQRVELYDLENDLGEQENLASTYPQMVGQLMDELKSWWGSTGADLPLGLNPEYDPDLESTAISKKLAPLKP